VTIEREAARRASLQVGERKVAAGRAGAAQRLRVPLACAGVYGALPLFERGSARSVARYEAPPAAICFCRALRRGVAKSAFTPASSSAHCA